MASDLGGVWRTIGGRRVFIKDGQSLSSAMKESGKFKIKGAESGDKTKRTNPEKIKTPDGYTLTKVDDGTPENAYIPTYRNERGDETLVPDANKYEAVKDNNSLKAKKDLAEKEADEANAKWHDHYTNGGKWKSSVDDKEEYDKWRQENDKLLKDWEEKRQKFESTFQEYIKNTDESELSWRDKARINDMKAAEERAKLEKDRPNYMSGIERQAWDDKYYGTYRAAERKNAALKVENPDEQYVNIPAYAGYSDKFEKTWGQDGSGNKEVSAKMYTNDEFMEHLTDANWHGERSMLEAAGLTNKQMEYVKEHTKVTAWGADLDKAKTQKLIDEAKAKYPSKSNTEPQIFRGGFYSQTKYSGMFNEYMKLHPNSKMTLQQFARMMERMG